MHRYRTNAYRVLGLDGGASLAACEERARDAATPDAQAALDRIRDANARVRERLFAPGEDARGRCAAAHEALIVTPDGAASADAGAWDSALDAWKNLVADPALRDSISEGVDPARVDEVLTGLPADLMEVNVGLGGEALARGDVAVARLHLDLLARRLEAPERTRAQERLVGPASERLLARAGEIVAGLDDLELGQGMQAAQVARARAAADAAATPVDALTIDAERLRAFDYAPTRSACDQATLALLRLAIVSSWVDAPKERTLALLERASRIACSEVLKQKVATARTSVRVGDELKDAFAARDAGKVDKARRMLAKKRKTADPELREQIDEILAEPRRLIGPLGGPPSLFTVNGVGVTLYGHRSAAPDGTYVATTYLCMLFVPIVPLASFLVSREARGWRFFGRVPLSRAASIYKRVMFAAVVLIPLGLFLTATYEGSTFAIERRSFSAIERALDSRAFDIAARELTPVLRSQVDSSRLRAHDLATRLLTDVLDRIKTPDDAAHFATETGPHIRAWGDETVFTPAILALLEGRCEQTASVALLDWGRNACRAFKERSLALSRRIAGATDEASFLAAVPTWHAADRETCPAEIFSKLRERLLAKRHATWAQDALAYLKVAKGDEAMPVLLARAESAWKGQASGRDLLPFLGGGPAILRELLASDDVTDLAKRAAAVEGIAEPAGLAEPAATWHRIGVARRLAKLHGQLNEQDPVRYPIGPARTWAIRASELSPDDPEACARAMQHLIEVGELGRAIALGEAIGVLRTPGTVTLLGVALSRSGRLEEAASTLEPYVNENLAAYAKAVASYQTGARLLQEQLYDSLRTGKADQGFIKRLNAMPRERANEEVVAWMKREVAADPALNRDLAESRARAHVHVAAFELAMVDIGLGRAMVRGPARDDRFGKAEKILVALRSVGSHDPTQEVQLGQVLFWLGKRQEGQAIFDRLESAGEPRVLLAIGMIYREFELGEAARRVFEAAHAKLPDGLERENAACMRGLEPTDIDDSIAWLERAGRSDFVQNALAQARGYQSLRRGDYTGAIAHLRRAAAFFARNTEDSTSLHNTSMAYSTVYSASGDPNDLKEALRLAREAVTRGKEDAIALRNYLLLLKSVGCYALTGDAVNTNVFRDRPGYDWFDLVEPRLPSAERAEKIKVQPELRRGLEVARRLKVIAPDGEDSYEYEAEFYRSTNDLAALRRLREDLETAGIVRAEAIAAELKEQRGEKNPAKAKGYEESLTTLERELPAIRKAGHGPTTGAALSRFAHLISGARILAPKHHDLDRAVAIAEEGLAAHDCGTTRNTAAWCRLERASRDRARTDERYRAWTEQCPDLSGGRLLWLYRDRYPDVRDQLAALEDVKVAADHVARLAKDRAWIMGTEECTFLEIAGHERYAETRKSVAARGIALESRRIDLLLSPQSSTAVASALLAARIADDAAVEKKIREAARARGVLAPYLAE